MGLPVDGLKDPPQLDDQFQLVGLPVAVAVRRTPTPSHQGDAGSATMIDTSGFGLIVKVYFFSGDVPQALLAVTVTSQVVEVVTVGAV